MMLHARGIEQQTKGVDNVLAGDQPRPGHRQVRQAGLRRVTTITGQGNGQGGREHGHKCDQLPGNRDITNPEHRAHVAAVWGCDESEIPGKGLPAQEIIEAIHAGTSRDSCRSASTRAVSAPDTNFTAEALDKLEFYAVIDFFLSESAHHADVVLPGSLHEEDEGTSTSGEGRIIKINAAVTRPARPAATGRSCSTSPTASAGPVLPVRRTPRRSSRSFASPPRAAPPTTAARRGTASRPRWACSGRSRRSATRARRACTRAAVLPSRRQGPLPRRAFRRVGRGGRRRLPVWLTTGRVVSQYLSGTQTRRIGGLVDQYPEPLCEIHPTSPRRSASPTATS